MRIAPRDAWPSAAGQRIGAKSRGTETVRVVSSSAPSPGRPDRRRRAARRPNAREHRALLRPGVGAGRPRRRPRCRCRARPAMHAPCGSRGSQPIGGRPAIAGIRGSEFVRVLSRNCAIAPSLGLRHPAASPTRSRESPQDLERGKARRRSPRSRRKASQSARRARCRSRKVGRMPQRRMLDRATPSYSTMSVARSRATVDQRRLGIHSDRLDIDVERIEEQAAVRRIRARGQPGGRRTAHAAG